MAFKSFVKFFNYMIYAVAWCGRNGIQPIENTASYHASIVVRTRFVYRTSRMYDVSTVDDCIWPFVTLPPPSVATVGHRSMCVCICLTYLQNYVSNLHQIFVHLPMAVARPPSGGVAIKYVLPVLWMTSCMHRMVTRKGILSQWLYRGSTGLVPLHGGANPISTIAVL